MKLNLETSIPQDIFGQYYLAFSCKVFEHFFFFLSVRSFGKGNGSPLQYSCLENPRERGAWWATVQEVAESHTSEQLTL